MKNIEKRIANEAKQYPKKFWNYVNQRTKHKENIPKLYKDMTNKTTFTENIK